MTADSILIVEDSVTQTLRLQNTLEKNGFAVTAARDGRAALDALAQHRPTLVISDIQMPVMDGYELCRRLKADPALHGLPIILLTSLSAPQDIIRGLECGADNFVTKPYDDDFLLARIRSVLANRDLGPTSAEAPIPIHFAGERYEIAAGRRQILHLLLSTYETAVRTNADLIKAHEELKAAQGLIIEAEKLRATARLAAGVAHEVRNPLSILEMGIDYLSSQPIDEAGQAIFQEMKEAVTRAAKVISGLMEESSPDKLGLRAASFNALLEAALDALRDDFARQRIEVVRRLAPGLPEPRVDAARISQLFSNLLANALHAMPDGGTLTVASGLTTVEASETAFDPGSRAGGQFHEGERVIFIELADTGTGIAPEHLDKLFEPFFSTKPTGQGMGLGLTVARKIADMHRGRIRIANRPDGGACVSLTFKTV